METDPPRIRPNKYVRELRQLERSKRKYDYTISPLVVILPLCLIAAGHIVNSCDDWLERRRQEAAERSRPPPGYMVPVTVLDDGLDKPRSKPCAFRYLDVMLEGKLVPVSEFGLLGSSEYFAVARIDGSIRVIPRHGAVIVAESPEKADLEAGGRRFIVKKDDYSQVPATGIPDECNIFKAWKLRDEMQKKYTEAVRGFGGKRKAPDARKHRKLPGKRSH